MTSEGEVWVQLATRIPKQLHRELKLYCVKSDVSVMDFVVSALQDKLSRESRGRERRHLSRRRVGLQRRSRCARSGRPSPGRR